MYFQPFAPSLPSERDVWLKLGYATLRKDTRILKKPTNLKRKYLTECIFLVLSEIGFQSIQCTEWLDLSCKMFKPKSTQEWNKEGWIPTFAASHFLSIKIQVSRPICGISIYTQFCLPLKLSLKLLPCFQPKSVFRFLLKTSWKAIKQISLLNCSKFLHLEI